MILNALDLYKHVEAVPININSSQVGTLLVEYQVQAYMDVRNIPAAAARRYLVTVRTRWIIPGSYQFKPASNTSFTNYPAVLNSSLQPQAQTGSLAFELLDYSPKTLNTSINTSQNSGDSSGVSYLSQFTSGSSYAQANSYEHTIGLGLSGDGLSGHISRSHSHGTTTTSSSDNTTGSTTTSESQSGFSAAMSIKDWASYASLDENNQYPTWLWGQEYPWNVLEFNNLDGSQNVILPQFVQNRLYDGHQIYPPSQLALTGVNFLATARWLVDVSAPIPQDEYITFQHSLTYFTASHKISGGTLVATIDNEGTFTYSSPMLDLPLLGLDPITQSGTGNGAVTGFSPQEFLVLPSSGVGFRILSGANNLYVNGYGFTAPSGPDGLMQSSFTGTTIITIQFKCISAEMDLALYLKHWKTSAQGCLMSIAINSNPPIERHVDALDAGSGSDNITTVVLRNKKYASGDYYNYLVMGLNTISITLSLTADPPSESNAGYAIRALAIG
jgi:hypothetical protein